MLTVLQVLQEGFTYRIKQEKRTRGDWILFEQKALIILKMKKKKIPLKTGEKKKKQTMLFGLVKPKNLPVWSTNFKGIAPLY